MQVQEEKNNFCHCTCTLKMSQTNFTSSMTAVKKWCTKNACTEMLCCFSDALVAVTRSKIFLRGFPQLHLLVCKMTE